MDEVDFGVVRRKRIKRRRNKRQSGAFNPLAVCACLNCQVGK